MKTQVIFVEHFYRSTFNNIEGKRQHTCLDFNWWCWKNALQNPLMAFRYLKRKIGGIKEVMITSDNMARTLYEELMREK